MSYTPPILIDARMKPWFPAEVECDPDTARLVSERWAEYFPNRKIAMGDSSRGHLDPPASQVACRLQAAAYLVVSFQSRQSQRSVSGRIARPWRLLWKPLPYSKR